MTIVFRTRAELRGWRLTLPQRTNVGFVPTMGALHDGHLSLVRAAQARDDLIVASIFVNPLQFGANEDFTRYPRSLDQDVWLLQNAGVTAVFAPSEDGMYDGDASTLVEERLVSQGLCGAVRPGHFTGVTTVVMKLLNLVQPRCAYFGQKDAQQAAVIQRMVRDLNVPVQVITCPTVREPDGLAMSSRNRYLSPEERAAAPLLYQSLCATRAAFEAGERNVARLLSAGRAVLVQEPRIAVQYFEICDAGTMQPLEQVTGTALAAMAAYLGTTRLIDNVDLGQLRSVPQLSG